MTDDPYDGPLTIAPADAVAEDDLSPDQAVATVRILTAIDAGERVLILTGPAGCITGDAEIIVNRAGKGFRLPLREVVRRFNGGATSGKTWDPTIETRVQIRDAVGHGRLGVLDAAVSSGVKAVWRVITRSGRTVKATDDHRFWTDRGWLPVRELRSGHHVATLQPPRRGVRRQKNRYATTEIAAHPFSGLSVREKSRYDGTGRRRKTAQRRVATHRLVMEARLSGIDFTEFLRRVRAGEHDGLVFLDPRTIHVHHKDGNHRNNHPDNLEALPFAAHHREHNPKGHVLWREVFEEIVGVEYVGMEETYDLCLREEPHNFTANGFVVHNSGKTTLVRHLARQLRKAGWTVVYMAPTGKAASRLRQVTGEETSTIHKALFTSVTNGKDDKPVFLNPKMLAEPGRRTVVICDEASMVPEDLHDVMVKHLPEGSVLLFVGDKAQVQPVNGTWGPDFDHPTAELTEIHRQALDNPIIRISMELRQGKKLPKGEVGHQYRRESSTLMRVGRWFAEHRRAGNDAVLLCWTNDTRATLNRIVRRELEHTGSLVAGDRLLVLSNNHRLGLMNGEILDVENVREPRFKPDPMNPSEPTLFESQARVVTSRGNYRPFLIHPDHIGIDGRKHHEAMKKKLLRSKREDWIHADYGEAITIHKSQGSQFEHVGLVLDPLTIRMAHERPAEARRLLYTAITRTKNVLRVFDLS